MYDRIEGSDQGPEASLLGGEDAGVKRGASATEPCNEFGGRQDWAIIIWSTNRHKEQSQIQRHTKEGQPRTIFWSEYRWKIGCIELANGTTVLDFVFAKQICRRPIKKTYETIISWIWAEKARVIRRFSVTKSVASVPLNALLQIGRQQFAKSLRAFNLGDVCKGLVLFLQRLPE